mgnify:CR=1 FL=1
MTPHESTQDQATPNNVVALKLEYIEKNLGEIKESLKSIGDRTVSRVEFEASKELMKNYVTNDQFAPVKLIAFSLVGLIVSTVIIYLLQTIIVKR